MKNSYILFILSLSFLESGCLVTMPMPSNRFESPETKGAFGHGEALVSFQKSEEIILISNTTEHPLIVNQPTVAENTQFGLEGNLGVLSNLDLYVNVNGPGAIFPFSNSTAPAMVGLKYQFLGRPEREATKGNFSLSMIAGGGYMNNTDDDYPSTIEQDHSYLATYAFETGALSGYRLNKYFLPYAGIFFSEFWNQGRVTQTVSNVPTTTEFNQRSNEWAGTLGIKAQYKILEFKAEFTEAYGSAGSDSKFQPLFGLAAGLSW